jgi:hypothetical protein
MSKKNTNIIVTILGLVGMTTIAIISIIDSHATDIASAIPVQLFFVGLFIAGYISYNNQK